MSQAQFLSVDEALWWTNSQQDLYSQCNFERSRALHNLDKIILIYQVKVEPVAHECFLFSGVEGFVLFCAVLFESKSYVTLIGR